MAPAARSSGRAPQMIFGVPSSRDGAAGEQHASGPVVALVLAAGAVVSFSVSDVIESRGLAAEDLSVGTWLLAWVLLCWVSLVSGAWAVSLLLRGVRRQPVPGLGAVVLGAALVLIAVAAWTHPLWGSGAGTGV